MASSCPGDRSATNDDTDTLQLRAQYSSNLTQNDPNYLARAACKKNGFYPSFVPVIHNLSTTTSVHGTYSLVYVSGEKFLPPASGTTYVNFTNNLNSYTKILITFFSTGSLSFVVPIDAPAGTYSVVVINIYNGNFSPQVNNAYPGILDTSNALSYILT